MFNNLKTLANEFTLPDFKLPEPYCNNVWPIKSWDYYKNSDKKVLPIGIPAAIHILIPLILQCAKMSPFVKKSNSICMT